MARRFMVAAVALADASNQQSVWTIVKLTPKTLLVMLALQVASGIIVYQVTRKMLQKPGSDA